MSDMNSVDQMREQIRDETLSEVADVLQRKAIERMLQHGPYDRRGAALWDAGAYVEEQMRGGNA